VLLSTTAFAAEEKALFEGRSVVVTRGVDATVEIRYDERGTALILRGVWEDPPNGLLEGTAYMHRQGCEPMGYRAKGVVDSTGALLVFGYQPEINAACEQTGSIFGTLRFTVPMRQELPKKAKPKPEAKPKPKPKPKPRPAPQPQPYQQQWQPWQWR
jgi:hypothetical protein